MEKSAKKVGLRFNEDKTKYMIWADNQLRVEAEVEKVYNFKELGRKFRRKPETKGKTKQISVFALNRVLRCKTISRTVFIKQL